MKNKLALFMTMSLFLTSLSPVNAAGTEAIEAAEEEILSVSFTEDEEDPEYEILEDAETVPEADVSVEEVIPEEGVSGLIEEEDSENSMICDIFTSEPVPVGDAEDSWGRAGSGDFMLSAASEPEGPEYYGSQLSGNQRVMYELLKAGNWVPCEDESGESLYTVAYLADTDYSFELDNADYGSSEEFQSIYQELQSDVCTAFDAYLYDYPEESFWIDSSGVSCFVYHSQGSNDMYHFSLKDISLNAYECWTGAKGQLAELNTYTDNSVAEIQAVDGYVTMTPGEKLKAVHDYICKLVSYGDASNVVGAQHTPYGAYDSGHKVVCEGYSKLFKILADKLGIADNVLVSGSVYTFDGSDGAHMWNVVSLEGSWYLLDVTWDDQDNPSEAYYDYFLAGSGDYGFSSYRTVGQEHTAHANLSSYGEEFIVPTLSETMYHQQKQTGVTTACTQAGSATVVCGLHPVMSGGHEVPAETVTIPATGHSWHLPVWAWFEDNDSISAVLTFTCKNDNTHKKTLAGTITSEITKDATKVAPGERLYTAIVYYNGEVYQDWRTEEIPKLPPSGVTDEGLSWEIADGVLTVSLQEDARSTAIPDYTTADEAPWAEGVAELSVSKIVVKEGITRVGSNAFIGLEDLEVMDLPRSLEELAGDSVDAAVLGAINVNYAGTESEWDALTQGTGFEDAQMTSTHTHIWNSGEVTVPATTMAAGIRTYTCTDCGETRTEPIAQLSAPPVPTITQPAMPSIPAEQITIPKKPTIRKPSAVKNKITVTWSHFKQTKKTKVIWKNIKKVQIQCAADKGFTNIVKSAMMGKGKTKTAIKGLQNNTTYYVRVRYFDGTGYSAWSGVKKVKTKK